MMATNFQSFISIILFVVYIFRISSGQHIVKEFQGWDLERESFRKSHFRIYAMNLPPLMAIVNDIGNSSKIEFRGTSVELANYLAQHYDLTLEYIFVPENSAEVAKFGQTQVLVNSLISKKIDLAPFGMTPSIERLQLYDMTTPSFFETFKIMVKWPEETIKLTDVVRPFDKTTWTMIAASFIVIIAMLSLFVYFHHGHLNETASTTNFGMLTRIINTNTMYIIGISTNHAGQSSNPSRSGRFSFRLMLGLWLLMMVVLINSYTSVLTSYMTVPKLKHIPQTLEELAEMKEYRVTMLKNMLLADTFLSASSGAYKILGDRLRQNPELLFPKYSQAVENVLKYNAANVDATILITYRVAADMKRNGNKCRLTVSNPISHTQSFSIMLPKNSPYTKFVNQDLLRIMEAGLYDQWKTVYIPNIDRCNLKTYRNFEEKTNKVITLYRGLSTTFFVFGVGVGFSFLIFLMERIVYYFGN